jgi:uncharacterized protein YjiS (DUF1127 family)
MTTIDQTRPSVGAIALTVRFADRLRAAFHNWWIGRQTRHQLRALDDHLLKDIGLRRYEIDQIGPNSQHEAMRFSG